MIGSRNHQKLLSLQNDLEKKQKILYRMAGLDTDRHMFLSEKIKATTTKWFLKPRKITAESFQNINPRQKHAKTNPPPPPPPPPPPGVAFWWFLTLEGIQYLDVFSAWRRDDDSTKHVTVRTLCSRHRPPLTAAKNSVTNFWFLTLEGIQYLDVFSAWRRDGDSTKHVTVRTLCSRHRPPLTAAKNSVTNFSNIL